ncbi:unnamed protein product [Pleuronectes platessa]|uniref:Uncharacterized protein n=1 Tax=Pleuronectes platessa TaxID=8262 RepID=A0A9N7V3X3_PLEPL|nr:unnamed protein product [Pleuronectes platessa]
MQRVQFGPLLDPSSITSILLRGAGGGDTLDRSAVSRRSNTTSFQDHVHNVIDRVPLAPPSSCDLFGENAGKCMCSREQVALYCQTGPVIPQRKPSEGNSSTFPSRSSGNSYYFILVLAQQNRLEITEGEHHIISRSTELNLLLWTERGLGPAVSHWRTSQPSDTHLM